MRDKLQCWKVSTFTKPLGVRNLYLSMFTLFHSSQENDCKLGPLTAFSDSGGFGKTCVPLHKKKLYVVRGHLSHFHSTTPSDSPGGPLEQVLLLWKVYFKYLVPLTLLYFYLPEQINAGILWKCGNETDLNISSTIAKLWSHGQHIY